MIFIRFQSIISKVFFVRLVSFYVFIYVKLKGNLQQEVQKRIYREEHKTKQWSCLAKFQEPYLHNQQYIMLSKLNKIFIKDFFLKQILTTPHHKAWAKFEKFLFTSFSARKTKNEAKIKPKNPMYNVVISS